MIRHGLNNKSYRMLNFIRLSIIASCLGLVACGGGSSSEHDNPPPLKPQVAPKANKTVQFFIAAHPDDIQLFMAKNAQFYVQHNSKNVFILTTAGDGGEALSFPNSSPMKKTFWEARFVAHEKSIHYWNNYKNNIVETQVKINQHTLQRKQFGDNVVFYNFLLPDGNMNGNGFSTTQFQSLEKLYQGKIHKITSVDGKNAYNKQELVNTLSAIVQFEAGKKEITFNIAEDNSYINPKDHSDHIVTSLLVQDVAQNLSNCMLTNKYTEYVNRAKPINMSTFEYQQHQKLWNVLTSVLVEYGYVNPHAKDQHLVWLGKQYISSNSVVNCKNVEEKLSEELP